MPNLHFCLKICTILVVSTYADGHPLSTQDSNDLDEEIGVTLVPPNLKDKHDDGRPNSLYRGLYLDPKGSTLWPGGIVYYRYEQTDTNQIIEEKYRKYFDRAMEAITGGSDKCIQFIEDKMATRKFGVIIYRKTNKVVADGNVTYEGSCFSECLGRCKGKTQEIVVTPDNCDNYKGNYAGSIAHELMHALGFGHEFSRHDRDQYITVDDALFMKGFGSSFYAEEPLNDDTKGLTFNYNSITQYDLSTMTKEKENPPTKPIGHPKNMRQECRISVGDRNLIELTYAPLCRADKKPKTTYKKSYGIVGTNCTVKIDVGDIDY